MKVELIPVIEIVYSSMDVKTPEKYPYWEYPELWNKYNSENYKISGFTDELTPYLAGSSFYRLSEITDSNLKKVVIEHTQEMREGKYERQQASAFFGGYVLRIDDEDKYFPKCCGDLADIHYWEKLAKGKDGFHAGHPQPQVKINGDNIILDLTVGESDEQFVPTPIENLVHFDIPFLLAAIQKVKEELVIFERRIENINQNEKLNIDNIGKLLIWSDENYQ